LDSLSVQDGSAGCDAARSRTVISMGPSFLFGLPAKNHNITNNEPPSLISRFLVGQPPEICPAAQTNQESTL
jgi:hypothetical protein